MGLRYRRIARVDFPVNTVALAKALLGALLVRDDGRGETVGKIVEVEAYLSRDDPGSHSHRGQTKRNSSMFLPAFHAYVYKIYGTLFCVNVSSEAQGVGEAVLIRALEPVAGLTRMARRRGTEVARDLCRGPGRLCIAMGITDGLDGADLIEGDELFLARGAAPVAEAGVSKRIGVTKAPDHHLRFYEIGSRFVSGPRHLSP